MKIIVVVLILITGNYSYSITANEVKIKAKEAVNSATEYTVEQKEFFQKEMDENLATLKLELKNLKAKAVLVQGEAQVSTNKKIKELEAKENELHAKMKNLKKSSGRAWIKMKEGMSSAWNKVKEAVSEAKAEMK